MIRNYDCNSFIKRVSRTKRTVSVNSYFFYFPIFRQPSRNEVLYCFCLDIYESCRRYIVHYILIIFAFAIICRHWNFQKIRGILRTSS